MTGRTTDGTWELGVRRTAPLRRTSCGRGWSTTPRRCWGSRSCSRRASRAPTDGVTWRVRSLTARVVTRLSWLEPGWTRPSTLQLRVLPAATGTTLALHHEGLPDEEARVRLLARWTARLKSWLERLDGTAVPTLHDWAGGDEALRRLIDCFYDRVEADELLTGFFPGGVSEEHRDHVAAWWSEVFGGPDRYTRELGRYDRDADPPPGPRHHARAAAPLRRDHEPGRRRRRAARRPRVPVRPARPTSSGAPGWRCTTPVAGPTDVVEHAPVPRWGWGVAPPYRP